MIFSYLRIIFYLGFRNGLVWDYKVKSVFIMIITMYHLSYKLGLSLWGALILVFTSRQYRGVKNCALMCPATVHYDTHFLLPNFCRGHAIYFAANARVNLRALRGHKDAQSTIRDFLGSFSGNQPNYLYCSCIKRFTAPLEANQIFGRYIYIPSINSLSPRVPL